MQTVMNTVSRRRLGRRRALAAAAALLGPLAPAGLGQDTTMDDLLGRVASPAPGALRELVAAALPLMEARWIDYGSMQVFEHRDGTRSARLDGLTYRFVGQGPGQTRVELQDADFDQFGQRIEAGPVVDHRPYRFRDAMFETAHAGPASLELVIENTARVPQRQGPDKVFDVSQRFVLELAWEGMDTAETDLDDYVTLTLRSAGRAAGAHQGELVDIAQMRPLPAAFQARLPASVGSAQAFERLMASREAYLRANLGQTAIFAAYFPRAYSAEFKAEGFRWHETRQRRLMFEVRADGSAVLYDLRETIDALNGASAGGAAGVTSAIEETYACIEYVRSDPDGVLPPLKPGERVAAYREAESLGRALALDEPRVFEPGPVVDRFTFQAKDGDARLVLLVTPGEPSRAVLVPLVRIHPRYLRTTRRFPDADSTLLPLRQGRTFTGIQLQYFDPQVLREAKQEAKRELERKAQEDRARKQQEDDRRHPPRFKRARWEAVQPGMPLEQVVAQLGQPQQKLSAAQARETQVSMRGPVWVYGAIIDVAPALRGFQGKVSSTTLLAVPLVLPVNEAGDRVAEGYSVDRALRQLYPGSLGAQIDSSTEALTRNWQRYARGEKVRLPPWWKDERKK